MKYDKNNSPFKLLVDSDWPSTDAYKVTPINYKNLLCGFCIIAKYDYILDEYMSTVCNLALTQQAYILFSTHIYIICVI